MLDNKLALPTETSGITADWLEQALSGYAPGVRVRDFEFLDTINTTCTKIRIRLDLENNRTDGPIPETVILKGGFEPHSRKMWGMHKHEALSYSTIVTQLGLRVPTPYFAAWDEDALQGIIIMEDLKARGVKFCSPLEPHSFEHANKRVKALARFHAQTWGSPEIQAGGRWGWLHDMTGNWNGYFGEYLEPDVWDFYIRSPRGAAVSVKFHDRHWMQDALDRMDVFARGLPQCANHGDTHIGNQYVDIDGEPGFFDCISCRAPGLLEISYYLGSALDSSVRRAHEGALIAAYLEELKRHGVDAPSFSDALNQYAHFLAFGFAIWIINESVFQTESNNTAFASRFSQAMLDHQTAEKLAQIPLRA
ncbi:MAG: hypothetical protein QM676_09455 [Novosphingobium sp.]